MENKLLIQELAKHCHVNLPNAQQFKGVDLFLPLIERIKRERGVFILRILGEELDKQPAEIYHAAISGGRLPFGDACRTQSTVLEEAVSKVILDYAQRAWGITRTALLENQ